MQLQMCIASDEVFLSEPSHVWVDNVLSQIQELSLVSVLSSKGYEGKNKVQPDKVGVEVKLSSDCWRVIDSLSPSK